MSETIKLKDSPKGRLKKFFKKRAVHAILIVGIVMFVLIGAYYIYHEAFDKSSNKLKFTVTEVSEKYTPCSTMGDDSILYEAIVKLDPARYKSDELFNRSKNASDIYEKVIGLDNHLNDANCLHILAMTSIIKENIADAEKYTNLLEIKAKTTSPEIYILDENPIFMPIDKMRSYIEGAKRSKELQKSNVIYVDMEETDAN